jgi:hypothetical protein
MGWGIVAKPRKMRSMAPIAPPARRKGLPWWAILLIVFSVLALLAGLVIGGAVWWFASNKDRLVSEGKQSISDAYAYAGSHDQSDCVDEGLRKLDACSGIMCEAQTKVFTRTCIQVARKSPGFCESVPPNTEIIKTSRWLIDECARRGKSGNQRCTRLLQAVPEVCHSNP